MYVLTMFFFLPIIRAHHINTNVQDATKKYISRNLNQQFGESKTVENRKSTYIVRD